MRKYIFVVIKDGECVFYDRIACREITVPMDQLYHYTYEKMTALEMQEEVEKRGW